MTHNVPRRTSLYKQKTHSTNLNLDLELRSQSEKIAIIKSLGSGGTKTKKSEHHKRRLERKQTTNSASTLSPSNTTINNYKTKRSVSLRPGLLAERQLSTAYPGARAPLSPTPPTLRTMRRNSHSGTHTHGESSCERSTSKEKMKKHSKHNEKSVGFHTRLRSYTFPEIVKIVGLLVNSTRNCRSHAVRAAEQNLQLRLMSLQQIRQAQRTSGSGQELMFDAGYFSSAASKNRHVRLNASAKSTLILPSDQRTLQSLQMVHKLFLQMKLLSQYPHQMQIQLCKVGYYSSFSASRVIIRQGHRPFYFYILISGSVLVNETTKNDVTDEMFVTTRCVLEKGDQFGETALLLNSFRNATVVCQSDVELLVIDKQDFLPMFASHVKSATSHISKNFQDIEHLQYLSECCEPFRRFPIHVFYSNPMNCVVHYFRKGSVIVKDIDTEWLYVVKSGTCKVVTSIPLEKNLKENARLIIESLRKHGFEEVEIYDLEFNSVAQKEQISRIREYIETPPPPRFKTCPKHLNCPKCSQYDESSSQKSRSVNGSRAHRSRCSSACISEPAPPKPLAKLATVANLMAPRRSTSGSEPSSDKESGKESLSKVCFFVCVRILKPGDTFGFETLVNEHPDIPLSVISNNAECVMVSKKLYQNFVPPDILISIKSRCQNFPYPTSRDIALTLSEQWKWFSYKKHLLCDTLMTHDLNRQQLLI